MIYYAEDDKSIRELVIYTLRNTGSEAQGFENGAELFAAISKQKPELILLDIMLPDADGLTILAKIRKSAETKDIPVIMVTAKDTEYDKITGLDSGADDYIAKPFGVMELVSRIKAVLRRAVPADDNNVLEYGNVCVNRAMHSVTADGKPVELTYKEYELLSLLMKNAGVVMTRDTLLDKVWDYGFDGETRTVDVHIRTLRSKLGRDGEIIETVRGVGYRIGGIK